MSFQQGRGGFGRGQGGSRESHPATCAECGAETTVPFKPTEGRPVYCRDCFRSQRGGGGGGRGGGGGGGRRDGPREMHNAICGECGQETQVPFKPTEGRPVFCRDCFANKRPQRF